MTRAWTRGALAATALVLALAGAPPALAAEWDYWKDRRHSFFLGGGYGLTNVDPANQQRQEEGINFTFTTDESDMGWVVSTGYWITDAVGLELSYWGFGTVTVPFEFQDPHDNSSGTGESKIGFSGPSGALLLGHDFGSVRVFGRLGALHWTRDMDTRFDIVGEPAIRRSVSTSGTGLTFGAGLGWRFHNAWTLLAQFERGTFDDDTIDLFTLGMEYDFLGLALGK